MKLREFIKKLREYQNIYGNINVETDQVEILDLDKMYFFEKQDNPFLGKEREE